MKLIVSILIAWLFALLGLFKFQWYFDIWEVHFINSIFSINLSFLKNIIDYIFYFPELIFNTKLETIKLWWWKNLNEQDIYVIIISWFYFLFSFILLQILKFFPWHNDRRFIVLWVMIWYILLTYFVKFILS